ncbi:uncharacterized protein J4E79_004316 [Alternaria viburni]|uniref:uncharacterized protein n=1 Tax=Alternaria viburni TaxID=566460 RepID=UPI0020C2125D|nr:uncharacterized protein J4E79_004316 [Alternaria viburni]KAI4663004.1 hypothetical protein J4E79_004316 [Alternaria viburni]
MARYQLRRPSPVKIFPRRVRRNDPIASTMPVAAGEEEEGPESPDSPFSSPSTVGGDISESEDSESEDEEEPPSPVQSGATATSTGRPVQTLGPDPTAAPSMPTSSGESDAATTSVPSFTFGGPSGGNNAAQPQITGETTLSTAVRPTITSTIVKEVMPTGNPERSSMPPISLTSPPQNTAEPELDGNAGPQRLPQREQEPIMTKEAMTAAIVLGVLGALALLVAGFVFIKRRKRRHSYIDKGPPFETFNPYANDHVPPPETAHVGDASSIFARLNGGNAGGATAHLTRSTDRSNTLFGPGPYSRPETVSTERSTRVPPTPNPFADPPLNKAYDVLNNRPRSTTLTDRGSWQQNPFKNPESERFDPFGELKEKARRERLRYVEDARREAELRKQMEQKEAMGLRPDGIPWSGEAGYR